MANNYPNFDVILIDNGSRDNSIEILSQLSYPNLLFIKNKQNLGFAEGNNIGIRHALENGADFVLLLNNDTIVKEDFISELIKQARKYPNAGAIGPKIYFLDRPNIIWFAGGYIDWKYDGAHFGYGEEDKGKYDVARRVDFISGCAMLLRRAALEKVGLLDSSLFAYHEDVDWCYRARKLGLECIYIPYPEVWHKGGSATKKKGRMSPFHRYLGTRNKIVVAKKNLGKNKFFDVLLREIFLVTPCYIALYSKRGHFDLLLAHLKGVIDALGGRNRVWQYLPI